MKHRLFIIILPIVLMFGLGLTFWQAFAQSYHQQVRHSSAGPAGSEQVLLKQYGGSAYAFTRQGDYGYLTIGSRLEVLDVSEPTNPIYLSQTPIISSTYFGNEMVISGTVGFLAADYQVQIFDLSDPVQPTVTAVYTIPSRYINDMVISGTLLFLGEKRNYYGGPEDSGLRILDVSDPFAPEELGYFGNGSGIEAIALKNDYVYLSWCKVDFPNSYCTYEFTVLNITDPTSPQEISSDFAGRVDDLEVYGDLLYHVETSDDDFRIYDISDPSTPSLLNIVGVPDNGLSNYLEIDGHYAYLYYYYGMRVYDLTNPITPTLYANYQPSGIYNILPDGDFSYIARGGGGLRIIDTTTPDLSELAFYRIYGWPSDIAEVNNYVYLLDGSNLHILDVSDPVNPVEINLYNHNNIGHTQLIISDTFGLKASGYGQHNFEIFDISNPLSPTHKAYYYGQSNYVSETELQGQYAYVAVDDFDEDNLEIVDISDPTQPTMVSSIGRNNSYNYGLEVSGNYAYMIQFNASGIHSNHYFTVIDISNKLQPQAVATQTVPYTETMESLALLNEFAYAGGYGVKIFDVTNPLSPTLAGVYTITNASGYNYEVASQDGYLYVTAPLETGRVAKHILDVTDPINPVKLRDYQHIGGLDMIVNNQVYTYVPERELGFSIYGPANPVLFDFYTYLPVALKNP